MSNDILNIYTRDIFASKSDYFPDNLDNYDDIISGVNLERERDREVYKRVILEGTDKVVDDINNTEKYNNEVNSLLKIDVERLEYKINKVVEKLRGAILAERNTTSTIYSTIVPITNQYTNTTTTTAKIESNVIFGISDTKIDEDSITPLTLNNLRFKNLNIKKLKSNVLKNTTITNLSHNTLPFEITINVKNLVSADSLVVLDLKDYAIVEIFKDGNLYKEKTLDNYFSIPVDINTETVTLRSYPTMHKSTDLNINILGITDLIYQESTMYESKDIGIAESLSSLVLDTCDNTSDNNIKIDYYISINGGEYERVNTVSKHSNKSVNVQSIIGLSKDAELDLFQINGVKRADGDIQYLLPDDIQNQVHHELEVYIKNHLRNSKKFYVLAKEDIHVDTILITDGDFKIDGRSSNGGNVIIHKGIREISTSTSMSYDFLLSIFGEDNIFSEKIKKPILKRSDYKYISLNNVDFLAATNSEAISDIYIKGLKREVFVSTIKLKAELTSLDNKTVPYISRFLIRGI